MRRRQDGRGGAGRCGGVGGSGKGGMGVATLAGVAASAEAAKAEARVSRAGDGGGSGMGTQDWLGEARASRARNWPRRRAGLLGQGGEKSARCARSVRTDE
ncbi:hypothetical protein GUJ93_ZPchr0010g10762 [Zizania palustris]|uniref:Uncharacterized protein n=1 Tax=Zizania palustris TaxID=103762 RepID=A0A8J5W773_ZIZPA|nr:hypothetical protein GUJ93_ZPchr0010g10762 [Zizania palustris]